MTTGQDETGSAPFASRIEDAVLGAAVAVVLSVVILVSQLGVRAQPDLMAYVFAVSFGAVLLLRRSMPVAGLVLSTLGTFAYYTLDYTPIGVALPVVAALYSAAEAGLTRWAVWCGGAVMAVSVYFRLRDDPQPAGFVLGTDSVTNAALVTAAIALGAGIRSRRLYIAQQAHVSRLIDAQHEREAQLRVQSERGQISRELHDTVGHMLTVISVHANVAREALDRDRDAVVIALDNVRDHSTRALQELRTMVGALRSAEGDRRRLRSIGDVAALLDEARAAGLDLAADISVHPEEIAPAVDSAVYRIVQEAITNVIRHADATRVEVTITKQGGHVHVRVTDNGAGARADSRRGFGLAGMTERARLLGGSLTSTGNPQGGHAVHATLPVSVGP